MKNIQIFGINITKTSKKEVLERIDYFLSGKKQGYFVTPNPEMLLEAGRDEEFFYVLNQADMALPDGIGLKFAGWAMGKNLERITGADLVLAILKIAKTRKLKVGIINWKKGLSSSKEIARGLWDKFGGLNFYIEDVDDREEVGTRRGAFLQEMQNFAPDILFVSFGAPFQEKFIFNNLKNIPSVKFAIGVGASFDYITGKTKRAPWLMRKIGLEWLWRLSLILLKKNKDGSVYKIKRSKRIYNAVFKFTLRFLKWRFILPFQYRKNVACMMYKKERIRSSAANGVHSNEEIRYKIFIVKRNDTEAYWQLPQGGVEKREDLKTAGIRELKEELGADKFRPIAVYKNIYKYNFQKQLIKNQRHSGYRGQKQSLFIAEFIGQDEEIKTNFHDHSSWMWVDSKDFVKQVSKVKKESAELYLQKFKEILELNK